MELPSNQYNEIPGNILAIIEEEVSKDIEPIKDEDPETANYLKGVMTDYRLSQYLFLKWLGKNLIFHRILYPASGFDIIPKLVFGEDKLVHTSLENYKKDDRKYFPDLGDGKKVIAENAQLPFKSSIFNLILLSGLPTQDIQNQETEFIRVLKNHGLVIVTNSILNPNDPEINFNNLKKKKVPLRFEKTGEAEVEFSVFLLKNS